MILTVLKEISGVLWTRIKGIERPVPVAPPGRDTPIQSRVDWSETVRNLATDPLNADLHFQYAIDASRAGRPYLAYAELKTAEWLGVDRSEIARLAEPFRKSLPVASILSHNLHYRYASLSSEILNRVSSTSGFSILDVGGGEGALAAFVPADASYCLAEPTTNGISGYDLPFPDRSFDVVVSCHVLEHVPVDRRDSFLDQLLAKSRNGVILLNPFHVDGGRTEERLRLIIEITGAEWAKEHLDCTLPTLDDLRKHADHRGLRLDIKPNGTLTTSLAFVFLDYFAVRSGCDEEWRKVNRFFNEMYTDILVSPQYPNSYVVYIDRAEQPSAPNA